MIFSVLLTFKGVNKGIPIHRMESNNGAIEIDPAFLPEPESAVEEYEATGGQLTIFNSFGEDPLRNSSDLVRQRESNFHQQYPDFTEFFYVIIFCFVKAYFFNRH